jgi:hypothetical protein
MYNFGWLQAYGKGKVIVLGHAGIARNDSSNYPSPGQFGAALQGDDWSGVLVFLLGRCLVQRSP